MVQNIVFETIDRCVAKYDMLKRGDRLVVGFSGGADSVLLMLYLLSRKESLGLEILAVHVNHGLRGEEADADEVFCANFCRERGVPIRVTCVDVRALAKKNGCGIEEAGRKARYGAFDVSAKAFSATKIAVAHNADDNAETMVFRFLRGTGLAGLGGIPPVNGKIIRPLIETPRTEIENCLSANNTAYVTDSSNKNNVYTRNKLRNELLPKLREFNPSVLKTLTTMARIWRNENDYLNELAYVLLKQNGLNTAWLKNEHVAMKRRVIRLALAEAGLTNDITAAHIERVVGLVGAQSGKRVPLVGGVYAVNNFEQITFEKGVIALEFCYELTAGQEIYIKELETLASTNAPDTLTLRTRLPGDKIKTGGGTKKLKDFIIEKKIGAAERAGLFYLTSGHNILYGTNAAKTVEFASKDFNYSLILQNKCDKI